MEKHIEPGSYNCVLSVTRKWHEMFKETEKCVIVFLYFSFINLSKWYHQKLSFSFI